MPWVYVCDAPDEVRTPPVSCIGGEHWEYLRTDDVSSGLLPDLSLEDGASLSMAIAFLWVIAFAWREIRRAVTQTDKGD